MIADSLTTTLTAEERGAISTPPTENPEAYRFYLQGLDNSYQEIDYLFQRLVAAVHATGLPLLG